MGKITEPFVVGDLSPKTDVPKPMSKAMRHKCHFVRPHYHATKWDFTCSINDFILCAFKETSPKYPLSKSTDFCKK